ncbi:MAG: DUF6152 family protein [Ketobacter sp.]
MKKVLKLLFPLVFSLLAYPAVAHHSVAAEYGNAPRVIFEGVIKELYWREPHARMRVEVTGGALPVGEVWDVNSHSPGILARNYGFPPDMVNVGDQVLIYGRTSQWDVPRFALYSLKINGGPEYVLSPFKTPVLDTPEREMVDFEVVP